MMRIKRLALLKSVAGLLTGCIVVSLPVGCVPVSSYAVDSYIGSLNQCLDIQGTYENQNYYRNLHNGFVNLDTYLPPIQFERALSHAISTKKIILWRASEKGKAAIFEKTWISFRFLNSQHLEITIFNADGQYLTKVIDMREIPVPPSWLDETEEFICNQTSWQRTYSKVSHGESGRDKTRIYSKTTKLSDGTLRTEAKFDAWGGAFGLYHSNRNSDRVGYFRKVDLTVDDIRAGNEKARRAIEQYDQVATTPPPQ